MKDMALHINYRKRKTNKLKVEIGSRELYALITGAQSYQSPFNPSSPFLGISKRCSSLFFSDG